MANSLALALAIVLPAAFALLVRPDPHTASDARRRGLRRALRLTRAATILGTFLVRGGAFVDRMSGLLESRRAMTWTVMAATVVSAAMVVGPRVGPPQAPATALGNAVFVLAGATGATLVLAAAPAITIGTLAAGYLVTAAVQWLTDVPTQVVVLELVGGLLSAVILAVGLLQTPSDRRWVGAARRLAAASSLREGHPDRLLPTLALAVALIVSYGMQSTALGEELSPQVVRTAFALASCGVVAVVFARSAVRLAGGVLLALAGFEIAYAQLDPGLLVSGSLAAFQLLFAVIASYYVAMPARESTES
jgi:hypothetical protein